MLDREIAYYRAHGVFMDGKRFHEKCVGFLAKVEVVRILKTITAKEVDQITAEERDIIEWYQTED